MKRGLFQYFQIFSILSLLHSNKVRYIKNKYYYSVKSYELKKNWYFNIISKLMIRIKFYIVLLNDLNYIKIHRSLQGTVKI